MNELKVPAEDSLCRSTRLLDCELCSSSALSSCTLAPDGFYVEDRGVRNLTVNTARLRWICYSNVLTERKDKFLRRFVPLLRWSKWSLQYNFPKGLQQRSVKCSMRSLDLCCKCRFSTQESWDLMTHTLFRVEGMCSLSQGGAAGGTAETLPVEEEPLGTDPLHHVNTLLAWVTLVAQRGECPSYWAALGYKNNEDEQCVTKA